MILLNILAIIIFILELILAFIIYNKEDLFENLKKRKNGK